MTYCALYSDNALSAAQLPEQSGWLLLEFGSNGCGHCQAAQLAIREAMVVYPQLRHIKIADGRGLRLGRFFRVKLWPTLVLLENGEERARLVRPLQRREVDELLAVLGD